MPRVNVIIRDDVLKEIDQASAEEKLSRSALLQKAVRQYLDVQRREKEANERKQRMEKAAAAMDRLADKFGKWDGVGTIRLFRDQRAGSTR